MRRGINGAGQAATTPACPLPGHMRGASLRTGPCLVIRSLLTLTMTFGLLPGFATTGLVFGNQERDTSGLRASLATDRKGYRPDQPVRFHLTVTNHSKESITLHCKDSQRFDIVVQDSSGKEIWRWSQDRMFAQMLGEETIGPAESKEYTAVFAGSLAPATYRASGLVVCATPPYSASALFTVR